MRRIFSLLALVTLCLTFAACSESAPEPAAGVDTSERGDAAKQAEAPGSKKDGRVCCRVDPRTASADPARS